MLVLQSPGVHRLIITWMLKKVGCFFSLRRKLKVSTACKIALDEYDALCQNCYSIYMPFTLWYVCFKTRAIEWTTFIIWFVTQWPYDDMEPNLLQSSPACLSTCLGEILTPYFPGRFLSKEYKKWKSCVSYIYY